MAKILLMTLLRMYLLNSLGYVNYKMIWTDTVSSLAELYTDDPFDI